MHQHLEAIKGTAYSSYASLYEEVLQGEYTPSDDTEHEYADYLNKLKEKEIFSQFNDEQRQKIVDVVSSAFVAMIIASQSQDLLPLDIYGEGIFLDRGKEPKRNQRKTTTSALGILQSADPVPLNDPARMAKTQDFLKPSEQSTYDPNAQWVQDNFSRLVHPFSNSISGTMLCQLRALAKIKELKKLVDYMEAQGKPASESAEQSHPIDETHKQMERDLVLYIMKPGYGKVTSEVLEQADELVKEGKISKETIEAVKRRVDESLLASKEKLGTFLKIYVSALLFNAGGHSLHEFVSPIGLAKVQEEFSDIEGFETLDLEELFLNTNQEAFDKALNKAIAYNEQILKKKAVNEEISSLKTATDERVIPGLINASQLSKDVKANLLELAQKDLHHAADCFRLVEKLQQLMIKNDIRVDAEYFSFFRQGALRQEVFNKNLNNAIIELSKGNDQEAKSIIEDTIKTLKNFYSTNKPELVALQNVYKLINSQVIIESNIVLGKS